MQSLIEYGIILTHFLFKIDWSSQWFSQEQNSYGTSDDKFSFLMCGRWVITRYFQFSTHSYQNLLQEEEAQFLCTSEIFKNFPQKSNYTWCVRYLNNSRNSLKKEVVDWIFFIHHFMHQLTYISIWYWITLFMHETTYHSLGFCKLSAFQDEVTQDN